MEKNTVKGLVAEASGSYLIGGLVGAIVHHASERKLDMVVRGAQIAGEDPRESVKYRGRLVEDDMRTLNTALLEILKIAKTKGYDDIRKIIEDNEYAEGHNFSASKADKTPRTGA